MTKFIAAPNATVPGTVVHAMFTSVNYDEYKGVVDSAFKQAGFDGVQDIDPDSHYPVQMLLDISKILDAHPNSMFNFVAIGKKIAENLYVAQDAQTVEGIVTVLNKAYHLHNDFDESELYTVLRVYENGGTIRDNTPYPHDMVYGYIHTLAQKCSPDHLIAIIVREFDNESDPDAGGATYDITYEIK